MEYHSQRLWFNPQRTARRNARSAWDTLHPGRGRAEQIPHRKFTLQQIRDRVT
ncbi:Eco29kI family restriction endonuclease [Amycolatopsis coloradensis]|uniref:Eco29kI family restriction endonuclease n=1 Tax=Amycolatopsis coloradensis TaxID=76021 RepID=UPI003CC55333